MCARSLSIANSIVPCCTPKQKFALVAVTPWFGWPIVAQIQITYNPRAIPRISSTYWKTLHVLNCITSPFPCCRLSVGTAHGFCLFDFCQRRAISATCTLDATETSATDDSSMSRRKSFKKSLRESFRRLRRRRSMGKSKREPNPATAARVQEMKA